MKAKLILNDDTTYLGESFGSPISTAGELVFSTGMVGYPESITDPSYKGQILIFTYPIIGSYGVPPKALWESSQIQVSALIVSNYIDTPSHFQSIQTLSSWFKSENIPLIEIKDTRFLTQKIRNHGSLQGKIIFKEDIQFYDPNKTNLVELVSTKSIKFLKSQLKSNKNIILIDCGAKNNIIRSFINRGVNVIRVPWDFDPFSNTGQKQLKKLADENGEKLTQNQFSFDAVFISNGPGDPKMAGKTISTIQKSMENKMPTLGICLGNQLLALAAGGNTYKLKFGHRSQNQPCIMLSNSRCFMTTQNHGFAIDDIPAGFAPWFKNANDNTIEGIMHNKYPFMAVQFHPESTPGPTDTEWIFDYFLEKIK